MNKRNFLGRMICGAALALTMMPATLGLAAKHRTASTTQAMAGRVDLNTASIDQLKAIPGIGDVYARRIVASRPYISKDQLVSKGVLPQGVYDKIKDRVVAHRTK